MTTFEFAFFFTPSFNVFIDYFYVSLSSVAVLAVGILINVVTQLF